MNVSELIREALATLQIDQAELARRLGVTQSAVSKWLSGFGNPDFESCLRLAKFTGRPAAQFLRAAGHDPSLLPLGDPEMVDSRAELVRLKRKVNDLKRLIGTITLDNNFAAPACQPA